MSATALEDRQPGSSRPLWTTGRFAAAYGVLVNLGFAAAGHWVFLERPAVNLDYLIVGALRPWAGARATQVLIGLVLANDLLINAAPACQFALPVFLRSLGQLEGVETRFLVLLLMAWALIAIFGAIAVVRLGGQGLSPKLAVGVVALSLVGAVAQLSGATNGVVSLGALATLQALDDEGAPPAPTRLEGPAVATTTPVEVKVAVEPPAPTPSPMPTVLITPERVVALLPSIAPGPNRSSGSAELLAAARDRAVALPPRNQVLVLVESMGEFRDADAAAQLLRPLAPLTGRYRVEAGLVPFGGPTITGEFRELCGARFPFPVDATAQSKRPYPECLPALMAGRGYHTVALHGFRRQMYSREDWYPRVGFQRMVFEQDLVADGITRQCGHGYRGSCDADVAHRLDQELHQSASGAPVFAYWMTLNSHLPTRQYLDEASTFDCKLNPATRDNWDLCGHAHALTLALEAVASIASDPDLPPTDFIVVGDHAPYPLRSDREAFDARNVPYVSLSWRGPPP